MGLISEEKGILRKKRRWGRAGSKKIRKKSCKKPMGKASKFEKSETKPITGFYPIIATPPASAVARVSVAVASTAAASSGTIGAARPRG